MNIATPSLSVVDSRGLNVRQVQYCRLPHDTLSQTRIHRRRFDAAGQLTAEQDPRLPAGAPNQTNRYSLNGARLLSQNVDAGWQLHLLSEARQVLHHWDQRGSHWQNEYDTQLRPVACHQTARSQPRRTIERLVYGDNSPQSAAHNQCGQVTHHYDPAGLLNTPDYALTRAPLSQSRSFLLTLDPVDWAGDLKAARSALEPTPYTTHWQYNAMNQVIVQTDAKGHRQFYALNIAGQLKRLSLQLKHAAAARIIVDDLHYDALDRQQGHTAGNGVVNRLTFHPADGRIMHLSSKKDHQRLQDMSYDYDPVGNVIAVDDATQGARHIANRRVEGVRYFTYDSLRQLITATGLEAVGATTQPQLPTLITPIDLTRRSHYTRHYTYDNGGNLIKLVHTSPVAGQGHTCVTTIDPASNRAVSWTRGDAPANAFDYDAGGNVQTLQPGVHPLLWTPRDQLHRVTLLQRPQGEDDFEQYDYDSQGMRLRKWHSAQAASSTRLHKQHYVPDLEVHTEQGHEVLHVITLQAGTSQVRCLHWPQVPPAGVEQDALRFSLTDHQESCLIELDGAAQLISHEDYYPYGGTACWAARSEVDANGKTHRHNGKQRDRSGLYYYGARYYAPWLSCWISPDPGGTADGPNLYCMVHNNPINNVDKQGLNTDFAYLIGGATTLLGAGLAAAALAYFKQAAPAAQERALPSLDFDLHPDELKRLQAFSKKLTSAETLQVRKLTDGSVLAYVPKNLQHATDLSNANDARLQKQVANGLPSIRLRDAPPPPSKKIAAPVAYSPFEVGATTTVSRKKAERIAAVEEVVQPTANSTTSGPRGANINTDQFFLSPHFLELDETQRGKITDALEAFAGSLSAAGYHKYAHDTEQDQNIAHVPGKQRTLRAIHTLDITSFEGTAGGRGDWRLVMYQIDGVFFPQRMDRHRDILARARR